MKHDETTLGQRAAVHAALGDPVRLRIVDILAFGDASSSELVHSLGIPSNLLAHHLKVLRETKLVTSNRSQGDGRRHYLHLVAGTLAAAAPAVEPPSRIIFVCTANSARSHLAAALWRRHSEIPAASAGTAPADRIDPGAIEIAVRRGLELPRTKPQLLGEVGEDELVITVCDLAHEALVVRNDLHWSIPDPVASGAPEAFDTAYEQIESRVLDLSARLAC